MLFFDNILKLSKILEDNFQFNIVNIGEGKALNHLVYMEIRIIRQLKSLEDQDEISEKNIYISINFLTTNFTWACQNS